MMVRSLEDMKVDTPTISIDSRLAPVGAIRPVWPTSIVKNEPMFFRSSAAWAYLNGGPITCAWLDASLPGWEDGIVDSRVHMLMTNFWPCIPGWHHDDVPREREDGQPDYHSPSYRTEHIATIVGDTDGVAATEFAVGACDFPDVPIGLKYYREWAPLVEEAIALDFLRPRHARYGDLIHFDDRTWHQGTAAAQPCWRWFGRITRGTTVPPANEVRQQVQVYLSDPVEGW